MAPMAYHGMASTTVASMARHEKALVAKSMSWTRSDSASTLDFQGMQMAAMVRVDCWLVLDTNHGLNSRNEKNIRWFKTGFPEKC